MKRVLNDEDFAKSMVKIEKEVAKIYGVTLAYVSAAVITPGVIEVLVARDYELVEGK